MHNWHLYAGSAGPTAVTGCLSVARLAAYGEPVEGTPFGRYRLIELLGRGGMGEVWRAYDTETNNRTVAIKVLPAHLADDDDFARRFRREADAAAQLDSPHVVPIYDYGEIDSRLFVCMRLIKGRDLDTVLADGPLEPARAARIIGQVAEALHAAHEIGLIHRDVKPGNILLDDRDFAYLIDFGIARVTDDTRMTRTGSTIGSFAYIAPERLELHAEEDARADIYSLACVLYEALTGEPPFAGGTTTQLMYAHAHTPPPRPSTAQPNVPAQFDAVIAKGMAKGPNQRYATTIELADAARQAITVPIQRPTPSPAPQQPPPAPYDTRPQPPPSPWAAASAQLRPESPAYYPPQFVSPAPQEQRTPSPMPLRPGPPTPTRAGRVSRRTTIALVAGVVALVAVIAVISIPALIEHRPSPSFPASSSSPTSTARTYGAQIVLPFTGLLGATGVAVDSTGTLYVSDNANNRVLKLAAGSSTQQVLPFTGLLGPTGVAVDGTGTVYVTDTLHNRVLKLAAGWSTQDVLPFTGLNGPAGVAVDSTGTVYVTDSTSTRVLKLAAGSSTQDVLPFTGLNRPAGVAVDSTGGLYVTDLNNRVLKLAAGSSTQDVLPFPGLNFPYGVAVDSTGTVYVTDWHNNRVLKLAAGSSTQDVLPFTGLNNPWGVTVDSTGTLYVTDASNHRVLKLPLE